MMTWFADIIQGLNDYAGLFALLALFAAILVPIGIYKKGREDERKAMQDELDSIKDSEIFPMSIEDRKYYARKTFLQKQQKK